MATTDGEPVIIRAYRREKERGLLWLLGALLCVVTALGGFMWSRSVMYLDDHDRRIQQIETWRATKDATDVTRDRMLEEIRSDVKSLLRKVTP